ncbi:hypothetical protein ACTA71_005175 [Dictyostelium dimigraforme]
MTRLVFSKEEVEIIKKYMESETPENISEIIRKELRIERCSSSIRTKIKNIKNSAKTNSASENLSENVNPATLAPATVNPATLTPATVNPATPTPATINPATLTTATVNPATINPATINPATINPATLTPAIINPATLAPATINPATLAPATVNPTTFANSTAIDFLENFLEEDLDSASQAQKKQKISSNSVSSTSSLRMESKPNIKGRVSFSEEMIDHHYYRINNMENFEILFCQSSMYSIGEATFSIGSAPTIIIQYSRNHPMDLLRRHTYKQQVTFSRVENRRMTLELPPESVRFKYCKNSIQRYEEGDYIIFNIMKELIDEEFQ